ncbi:MAG: PPC domain-containing protein [Ardenticatenaceae bacterium]|nr:PPC domain-containing protein [Ardenticatenaceae bacterium]MCB9443254.1 PPC domain-containing protein [Ardenticatenaceae bacterium]
MNKFNLSKVGLLAMLTSVVLASLMSLPMTVWAESEPNDSFATADPIGIGLSNAEVNATINPLDDLDYYSFTAQAGRTYVIETYNIQGSGNSATGLWLYDSSQALIVSDHYGNNGTGNANARIVYTFSTTGTYYILVKERLYGSWTGTYSLRILPKYDEPGAAWDLTNDNEPNDVMALANEIVVGLNNAQTHQLFNHSSYVTNDSDYDYYRFTVEAGRTYVIETFNIQGTSDNATGLWLYDSSGTLITSDHYGGSGTGESNARIVYTFSTTGTYFVLVKDRLYGNWTGPYSIRILPKFDEPGAAWDAANDNEPNDVMALANEVKVGLNNAQTHQLFDNSDLVTNGPDYDYYRFTAQAGRTYVIETYNIQGTGSNATGLWLYDSSGALITSDHYGNNGTGNANARIIYTFSTTGTYFILAKVRQSGNWTGTYSIRILPKYNEPGAAWNAGNDNEPNDVMALANSISPGVENGQTHQLFDHSNYVTNNSDYDYYHFTAVAGTTYLIQTYGIQATSRATGLWLYNDSGTELTNDRSGDYKTGTAEIEYTFSTSGEYFILVKDAQSTNWTGPYSVRVCPGSCSQFVYLPAIIR